MSLGRTLFDEPLLWTDEVANLALTTIAFIGGAVAYRRNQHIAVRFLVDQMPRSWREPVHAAADWFVLLVAVLCFFPSIGLLRTRWDELTPMLELPAAWLAMPLTIGMVLMVIYALARLAAQPRRAVLISMLAVAMLTVAAVVVHTLWPPVLTAATAITAAIAVVLITVLLGLPVGFALVLATALFLYGVNPAAMVALPQNMADGVARFVLLALPFFILAGFVMEAGGISRRLVLFVAALVGRLRGGLLQVVVVSMYIVSGISGSKAADVAAVGLVMRDMLDKEGYDRSETAVVLASSAAMGECVPPSIAMLVLGSVTSLSMGALFAVRPAASGGHRAVPDGIGLPAGGARRRGAPSGGSPRRSAATWPECDPAVLDAGLVVRRHLHRLRDADRDFRVRGAYGLLIAIVVYREISLRAWSASPPMRPLSRQWCCSPWRRRRPSHGRCPPPSCRMRSRRWCFRCATTRRVPARLDRGAGGARFAAGRAAGAVDPGAAVAADRHQLGISDLHYGIVLLIAMGIGAFLPPLGVGFYIACAIARAPMGRSTRAMVPYVAVLLVGLLLVTFVPWFTLSLPRALGLAH